MNIVGFVEKEAASHLNQLTWPEVRSISTPYPGVQELAASRAGVRPGSTFFRKEGFLGKLGIDAQLAILPNSDILFGGVDEFNNKVAELSEEAKRILKKRNKKNGETKAAAEFDRNKNAWNDGTWYDKTFMVAAGATAVGAIGAGVYAAVDHLLKK